MEQNNVSSLRSLGKKITSSEEFTVIIPAIGLLIFAVCINPVFLGPNNLSAIARMMAVWGIMAIGQSFVIMTGELDISIGTMLGFAAMEFAFLITEGAVPIPLAILITAASTVGLSCVSAFCILKFKIPSFIATIAMQMICKGLSRVFTYAAPIGIYSHESTTELVAFGSAKPFNTSWAFVIFVILIIIAQIVIKRTALGRRIYAVGDNKTVAQMAGINVAKIKYLCFSISGCMVALGAILTVAKEGVANPIYGEGWEFISIAATAIGGVSLIGGRGSFIGTFLGTMIMVFIYNIIILTGVNPNFQSICIGAMIALATVVDIQKREKMLGKNI